MAYYFYRYTDYTKLLSYYFIDFVNLYPYNDVSKHTPEDPAQKITMNYLLPLISALCNWYNIILTKLIEILIASLFLRGNIRSWWIPYFFRCSDKKGKEYDKAFGRTIKILPPIKDHPISNLEHLTVLNLVDSIFC
ncbi:hypothetical protein B1F79_00970 [Coxiella-like endosymbiont of Rhipicephalus sanguineus]|nr:hypothetical protein [Coxiella-like endosymbiont of Rhipicephalus sanguineus]